MNHEADHPLLQPIEQVARLTRVEDRDASDTVLVSAILQLLGAEEVTIFEVLGELGDARCVPQVYVRAADGEPRVPGAWATWEDGEPLEGYEGRLYALNHGEACDVITKGRHSLVIPVLTGYGRRRLLEVHCRHRLDTGVRALAIGVVAIYRNFLNLLDYSERDTLTSLLNRKSFDETFYKVLQPRGQPPADASPGLERRSPVEQADCWLGVVDIDHFKRVNDDFGHLMGDEVLLLVTRVMRTTFRQGDSLYRFGGEEFVIMLRAVFEEEAAAAFERLRENVLNFAFPQVGQVTVSIGFTRLRPYDDPSSAFERADKAVYLAKAMGRNQVRNYEQQVACGLIQESEHSGEVDLF